MSDKDDDVSDDGIIAEEFAARRISRLIAARQPDLLLVNECISYAEVLAFHIRALRDTTPTSVLARAKVRGSLASLQMLLAELDRRSQ